MKFSTTEKSFLSLALLFAAMAGLVYPVAQEHKILLQHNRELVATVERCLGYIESDTSELDTLVAKLDE